MGSRQNRFKNWFGDWESLEKSNNFDKNKTDNDQRTAIYNQLESVLGRSGTQETQVKEQKTDDRRASGISPQALRKALIDNAKKTGNYISDVSALSSKQLPSGHESEVHLSTDRKTVLKVNRLPFLNDNFSFNDWVEKIIAHNQTFPDVAYTIIGVTKKSPKRGVQDRDGYRLPTRRHCKDSKKYCNSTR